MHHRLVPLAAVLGLVILQFACASPHPFFDDAGMVHWRAWQQAPSMAQKYNRPIFLEASKDKDKNCEKLVTTTFRDERIAQYLNRYFIPVTVDFANPPADLKPALQKAGKTPPLILFLNERGTYIDSMSGYKKPNEVEAKLIEVLTDKAFVMTKAKEMEVEKLIEALDKEATAKDWTKAVPIFRNILGARGYSPLKDKAYDIMETAQGSSKGDLKSAYDSVRQDQYGEAKKTLEKLTKDWAGAPVADTAKTHLAAVKLLESAHLYASDAKVPRKADAIRQLDLVLRDHGDTPYGNLAFYRKKELVPPPPAAKTPAGK
ncbi:hypothetical protein AYO44_03455 [Planctomycetaceae bacterium SCGC AG-212-F19]|nr:hypothetical protein AYO44_03455 [Planctomycetaceae bacterium SCGC AG-212-F19]